MSDIKKPQVVFKMNRELFSQLEKGLKEVVSEFANMRDGTVIHKDFQTIKNGLDVELQVISCRQEPCYAQVVVFDSMGSEVECSDALDSLSGETSLDEVTVSIEIVGDEK